MQSKDFWHNFTYFQEGKMSEDVQTPAPLVVYRSTLLSDQLMHNLWNAVVSPCYILSCLLSATARK